MRSFRTMKLTPDTILSDNHGRRFADVLEQYPKAVAAVLEIMNGPDADRRLIEAEIYHDRPALSAFVREFEAHPDIQPVLKFDRFRQFCGVLTKLKMRPQNWDTTGIKGAMTALSDQFKTAERYQALGGVTGPGRPVPEVTYERVAGAGYCVVVLLPASDGGPIRSEATWNDEARADYAADLARQFLNANARIRTVTHEDLVEILRRAERGVAQNFTVIP